MFSRSVPGLEAGDAQQVVDDVDEPLRLGGDVAEEGRALGVRELDVAAHERLREAVDRGERRAELVRDRGDEVRLHLLDDALAGDVAEGEDAAGDGPARVEHDRLAEREPDLLVAALDRERALAGRRAVLRREIALQDLRHAAAERFLGGDAADLLGGRVPQDDVPVAVDGDDAVGDVGEDRLAPLLLLGDALVELGAREDRRRSRGECRERLRPRPRARFARRSRRP